MLGIFKCTKVPSSRINPGVGSGVGEYNILALIQARLTHFMPRWLGYAMQPVSIPGFSSKGSRLKYGIY